ncbi:DUF1772 domain-containing protein [Nocardiopsis mangrovi]|uniref:DUF1772 domain-containing protein n=1 Tax=Nocardiopsis mangrovi TaxID=1179818 RepID=A0ABV9DU57_9ACTN
MADVVGGVALVGAVVAMGMFSGLFYGFAVAVMPGLRGVGDGAFVEVMQRINRAILNGWFFAVFFGAPVLMLVAAGVHLEAGRWGVVVWVAAALALYGVALVGTMAVNVPLNTALERAGAVGRMADPGAVRRAFEAPWVRWNAVRALASTGSLGCLAWALVLYGGSAAAG